MKDFLIKKFRIVGYILYFFILILISIVPLEYITNGNIWLNSVIIWIEYFIPLSSIILWIWGLIIAINSDQTTYSIIYFLLFAIIEIPFFVSVVISLKNKNKTKSEEPVIQEQASMNPDNKLSGVSNKTSEPDRTTYIKDLVIAIVKLPFRINKRSQNAIICSNDYCCCDLIIFVSYVIRAMVFGESSISKEKAKLFSNKYNSLIRRAIPKKYPVAAPIIDDFFANRVTFYDRVFTQRYDMNDVLDEFINIVIMDYSLNKYQPYTEDHPLIMCGLDVELQIKKEALSIYNALPESLNPMYKNVVDFLSK